MSTQVTIAIVIVVQLGKSLNDFVILDGYMKTHSGDSPGESECFGRISQDDINISFFNNNKGRRKKKTGKKRSGWRGCFFPFFFYAFPYWILVGYLGFIHPFIKKSMKSTHRLKKSINLIKQ